MNILPTLVIRALPDMASSHSSEPELTQSAMYTYDGLRMDPMLCPRDVLVRIKDLELSPSDVLLSSYMKAGRYMTVHVQFSIIQRMSKTCTRTYAYTGTCVHVVHTVKMK